MAANINADTSGGLKLTSDTSGVLELKSAGTTIATVSSTGIALASGKGLVGGLTSGTAVATTSGTAVDFTGLPSTVKRITVMFRGVSSAASDTSALVQLGTSGGLVTTGYVATSTYTGGAGASSTSGFVMYGTGTTNLMSGIMTIANIGSNEWVASHAGRYATAYGIWGGGEVDISGTLDTVRILLISGGAFDAGSVNIMYE